MSDDELMSLVNGACETLFRAQLSDPEEKPMWSIVFVMPPFDGWYPWRPFRGIA